MDIVDYSIGLDVDGRVYFKELNDECESVLFDSGDIVSDWFHTLMYVEKKDPYFITLSNLGSLPVGYKFAVTNGLSKVSDLDRRKGCAFNPIICVPLLVRDDFIGSYQDYLDLVAPETESPPPKNGISMDDFEAAYLSFLGKEGIDIEKIRDDISYFLSIDKKVKLLTGKTFSSLSICSDPKTPPIRWIYVSQYEEDHVTANDLRLLHLKCRLFQEEVLYPCMRKLLADKK